MGTLQRALFIALLFNSALASGEGLWKCGERFTNRPHSEKCEQIYSSIQCTADGQRSISRAAKSSADAGPVNCMPVENRWNAPVRFTDFKSSRLKLDNAMPPPDLYGEVSDDDLSTAFCIIEAIRGSKTASKECGIPSFNEISNALFPE